MRLAFMGTPDFAVPTLKALVEAGHEIAAVYTQPPAKAGRGKKLRKSPVHQWAEDAGLDVHTPASMKDADAIANWQALDLDMAVVVAYGQILPKPVLDAPKHGCVNVHASLLPRWRGAAPIHRAIMAGDAETGVCIMVMEEGLDTGPVIARDCVDISEDTTTASLHDTLADMGGALIGGAITAYAAGETEPEVQSDEGVTYAKKIEKSEARIHWEGHAVSVDQHVRGLFPFPGAWCEIAGERVKVLAGDVVTGMGGEPGIALDDALLIACGNGAYRITRAQRAGAKAMDADDFLRGFAVPKGTDLNGGEL